MAITKTISYSDFDEISASDSKIINSIQRGYVLTPSGSLSIKLSPVDVDRSLVIVDSQAPITGNTAVISTGRTIPFIPASLTSDTLTLTTQFGPAANVTGSYVVVSWQVVEFK